MILSIAAWARTAGLAALAGLGAAMAGGSVAQTAAQSATTASPATARPASAQPLPRATFITNMDAEYRRLDSDRNGALTRVEIESAQRQTFQRQAAVRNQQLFRQLDADKNGQLSAAEFARLASAAAPQVNAVPVLTRHDGNRDGKVTLIEYRASTLANFDKLDTDKDGIVTPAEMKAGGILR